MILHILKKDLRLLWPFVAGLAGLAAMALWSQYGFSVEGESGVWPIFAPLAAIGWIVVVALLVHQDVIPGERQDWLTRPIERRDLFAAKLSFLIGLLHLPLFAMMTLSVLAAGFSLPEAARAALTTSLAIFVVVTLPTFVLAAVTRNFMETIVAGLVLAVVLEAAATIFDGVTGLSCGATCDTSLSWIGATVRLAVVAAAGAGLLALQYFMRGATSRARVGLLVAAVVFVLAGRVPWSTAFAVQRAATGAPEEPPAVAVSFDRGRPPAPHVPYSEQLLAARSRLAGFDANALFTDYMQRQLAGDTTVELPLRIAGQRAGTVLWADRVELRLVDAAGRVVYRGEAGGLEVRTGTAEVAQTVSIPPDVFSRHAGSALRAELDFWLTELEEQAAATAPAAGGGVRLASGEQCSLREAGGVRRLSCLTARRPPACYSAGVEGRADVLVCAPSYWPEAISANLLSRFELDLEPASTAPLRVATYAPRDHFTAQLVIPELRLVDWAVSRTTAE